MADVRNRTVLAVAATLALGMLATASCERLSAKKIGTIVGQPNVYDGQTVTVIGKVQERIDVPSIRCFVHNDGTGSIGVLTKGRLPHVGQKVLAKGRVQRSFAIGARKLTVIVEQAQPTPPALRKENLRPRGPG